MSVREQLFVRSGQSPAEVASLVAELVGGRVEVKEQDQAWLLVETALLVPGVAGEFGGPVVSHASEAQFRPAGEFEAPDEYTVEIRLWQVGGPRIVPAGGADVEELAATAVFAALAASGDWAVIHVHDDDKLRHAVMPGRGAVEFASDTTIYDWDEDKWNGFVLVGPQPGADDAVPVSD